MLALVAITVFLRTEMHHNSVDDGGIYIGALFFSVAGAMFDEMSELPMTIAKLPVFYKQRNLLFFPAWAYALPTWILKIPISFLEVAVWVALPTIPSDMIQISEVRQVKASCQLDFTNF